MRVCVLDGKTIADKEMLHDILTAALELPSWYGRNLDALYDCLTDMSVETEIRILNEELLQARLGNYALGLMKVIRDASAENPVLQYKPVSESACRKEPENVERE